MSLYHLCLILFLFLTELTLSRELLLLSEFKEFVVNWNCCYRETWGRSQDEDFRFPNNLLSVEAILLCYTTYVGLLLHLQMPKLLSVLFTGVGPGGLSLYIFQGQARKLPPLEQHPFTLSLSFPLNLIVFLFFVSVYQSFSLSVFLRLRKALKCQVKERILLYGLSISVKHVSVFTDF